MRLLRTKGQTFGSESCMFHERTLSFRKGRDDSELNTDEEVEADGERAEGSGDVL